jgi:hypothetical protein
VSKLIRFSSHGESPTLQYLPTTKDKMTISGGSEQANHRDHDSGQLSYESSKRQECEINITSAKNEFVKDVLIACNKFIQVTDNSSLERASAVPYLPTSQQHLATQNDSNAGRDESSISSSRTSPADSGHCTRSGDDLSLFEYGRPRVICNDARHVEARQLCIVS